ncbi:tetratricopeptide repeat-containing response regulator [Marinobacter sp.]|uniref:tetratricopeptide repeat-containing response regulator n=1 Tax=Marinobacter sp. TaxID=50741 RepID=UPI0019B01816|nr:tetratricopeptide repeat-containing response regulator [Marinobacter sp.]MBC7192465.1 tetratricopeptide repeat protein [Marinobacter sp.]
MTDNNPTNSQLFGKLSYLVVDDFENFRLSLRQMLRSCGADKIELVPNATTAIQYTAYNPVDVVLCDYNLGDGKNGQHILEELRQKKLLKRASLFLMVTAETSRDMVMSAREYQPDAYLTKPINRAMLEKRLGSLLKQRQALLPVNREIDRENYPSAISLCLSTLPKQPRYKTWLMKTLADLYYKVGDLSNARKIFDEVLEQRELSWARLGKCRVLIALENYEQAVNDLKELVRVHPDYMEAYDLLAEALEAMGRPTQAQQILEKATEHSPHALLRQKHLASLAATNQDMEAAAEAWRSTVELGTWSIHDSPEHYLALGQSLSDLSEGDLSKEGAQRSDEALRVLKRMEKRFPDQEAVTVRSRIVQSRIHAGQGRPGEAEKLIEAAEVEIDPETIDADTGVDFAKTLFRLGREDQANELLGVLARRFGEEPETLQKIENLLDEPVGFRQKLQARSFNREGIKAFEDGELDKAARAFREALEIVPSHAALNLNLIQVLLKQHQAEPDNNELIGQCRKHLAQLSHLPAQHRQYRRYTAIKNKLEGMPQ